MIVKEIMIERKDGQEYLLGSGLFCKLPYIGFLNYKFNVLHYPSHPQPLPHKASRRYHPLLSMCKIKG